MNPFTEATMWRGQSALTSPEPLDLESDVYATLQESQVNSHTVDLPRSWQHPWADDSSYTLMESQESAKVLSQDYDTPSISSHFDTGSFDDNSYGSATKALFKQEGAIDIHDSNDIHNPFTAAISTLDQVSHHLSHVETFSQTPDQQDHGPSASRVTTRSRVKTEDPDYIDDDDTLDLRPRKKRAKSMPPSTATSPSMVLVLPRITTETVFRERFLKCELLIVDMAAEYLSSKRKGIPWISSRIVDTLLFDYAFVSRKSGQPKDHVLKKLREPRRRAPQRWTQSDDLLILYLKEVENLTWKEAALLIRYRHSWQAVQMRYLRTLCRLTGEWSEEDTNRLKLVVSRDWATRWKRIATEMGPQFPIERCYRKLHELAGEEVDYEVLDLLGEPQHNEEEGVIEGYSKGWS